LVIKTLIKLLKKVEITYTEDVHACKVHVRNSRLSPKNARKTSGYINLSFNCALGSHVLQCNL